MALSELELKRVERAVGRYLKKHRPPPHIRPELDVEARIQGQSVELVELRPAWRGDPGEITELPFAKTTFVRTQHVWKVFWRRADLRWHAYDPPTARTIDDALALVDEDAFGCFRG
ncbi:DUF3024 domain-containing protein [Nitrogeniibacter mangrovi]|uniref:DUF3024 domain-containing protein n=1 Tax=Nitrogeniibacter mangrovi TaxID=2016596 RepID=A0A6C1B6I0_9RHOO|nr:DUF3024 domain-containing protein [Nitrogeniibacter mangrovi]QID19342.1 DUF3024 domain-containing protein [Nitrogeniibacter mangrovi]